jgi:hypothetical protein
MGGEVELKIGRARLPNDQAIGPKLLVALMQKNVATAKNAPSRGIALGHGSAHV